MNYETIKTDVYKLRNKKCRVLPLYNFLNTINTYKHLQKTIRLHNYV